jgi:hypothetical protein
MSRSLLRTLLLTCLALAFGAAAAQASPTQAMIFDAQRDLTDPATRDQALTELESLGVRHVRVLLYWKDVAPSPDARSKPGGDLSDPAAGYDWSKYEPVMAALRARGWKVLMTVTTPGPKWAMDGRKDYVTRPSKTDFGRFVTAVGRKYGGQVSEWAVLNEPNHPDFLGPQYDKKHRPRSPGIYRGLFQAADKALKATGNGNDTLLLGETAPRGTGKVVAPLTFLRGTLCLSSGYKKRSSCGKLDADGWAHHAYTTKAGPFFVPPGKNDVTIGVLSRLNSALDKAGRAGAIRRSMPIYLTEFGIQSSPDRFFGVSLSQQPEYRSISERLAYSNPRVKAFSQYLLRDDLPREGVPASARYGGFESGLRFANGGEKPSLVGFRLPLAVLRDGASKVSVWGMVRGAPGPVSAQVLYQDAGSRTFKRLKSVRTNARGYFSFRSTYRKNRRYRLRFDGADSPVTRSYRRP